MEQLIFAYCLCPVAETAERVEQEMGDEHLIELQIITTRLEALKANAELENHSVSLGNLVPGSVWCIGTNRGESSWEAGCC